MPDSPRTFRLGFSRSPGQIAPGETGNAVVLERMKAAAGVNTDPELGDLLGVKRGAVSSWRRRGVPPAHIAKISEITRVPFELLMTGRLETPPEPPGFREQVDRNVRAIRVYMAAAKARGEDVSLPEAAAAVHRAPGTAHELPVMALALALVEAEQERRAERPGEDFRASQLAGKVTRILKRQNYIYNATLRSGTPPEDLEHGIKEALGLPENWNPDDPW